MNKKCQIFTPENYVDELLNNVGYTDDLYGRKILENSCGDGNILISIVQRYIDNCLKYGLSRTKIKNGLAKDIYGVEIDPVQYEKCINRLNNLVSIYNIKSVDWKIYNEDYLKMADDIQYDFIVGNPPYITYRDISKEDRNYLKNNFLSCEQGKFDYCYAFIEKSINCLSKNGKMSYLIPSSIFKTVFGTNVRNCIKPYIEMILDFSLEKIFDNALVKSSIIVLNKNKKNTALVYTDASQNIKYYLDLDKLNNKWVFTEKLATGNRRFGDYFKVSHVVATLYNDAFVLKDGEYEEIDNYYICNNFHIEKSIVKDTFSPKSIRSNKKEKIIFPYYYINDKLTRYTEKEFIEKCPGAFDYLKTFQFKLNSRKSDKNTNWFEYGRTQALNNINKPKLLLSTVITSKVKVYKLDAECIPYSGLYIITKNNRDKEMTLNDAIEILKSNEFMNYANDVGTHISGNSIRITSKDIENYTF